MKVRQTKTAVATAVGLAGIVVGLAAPAAATQAKHAISGSTIKKHSISGNRLKNGTLTGTQINLKKLGTVPTATRATSATLAAEALTLPALVWHPLTLENSWTATPNHYAPAYAIDAQGVVHLRGDITGGGTGDGAPPFQLATAITPKFDVHLAVNEGSGFTDTGSITFGTTGKAAVFDDPDHSGSATANTDLDGLSYYPGS